MLGLRLAKGIDLARFDRPTVEKIWQCLQPYARQGWVEIVNSSDRFDEVDLKDFKAGSRICLNDPEGFLFSNTILAALFETLA